MSTRTDLLPPEFAVELAKLQDSLKPLPSDVIEKAISDELGRPVNEVFASFDPVPVGVASIGQAHAAKLRDGTEVVVKARKPGVVEQVEEDLEILRQLAVESAHRWEGAQEYDLVGIVEEIAESLMAEMDYVKEGHNAEYFAKFIEADPSIHIPKVLWEFTTSRVITLERIRGIGILDVASLERAGEALREPVAENGL
jgi:ubiquinone biosynthesis protein